MPTTLYLVRHAQAHPRPDQTEPEWELSPTGCEQARALVPVLAELGIQRAYTSPFRRTRETLAPFCAATGIALLVHDGLRERCLSGGWIGDFRDVWRRSWADLTYALPDGESSLVCRDRMETALRDIVARHPGETIVAASHGFAVGLFLTTLEAEFGESHAGALRTPELLKLVHDGGSFHWRRAFAAGPAFDAFATHFRQTPGIVA